MVEVKLNCEYEEIYKYRDAEREDIQGGGSTMRHSSKSKKYFGMMAKGAETTRSSSKLNKPVGGHLMAANKNGRATSHKSVKKAAADHVQQKWSER